MMNKLNKEFWTKRYQEGNAGWDIGMPSTPLKEYIDGIDNKDLKILIPGAGNAHEAEYLWKLGFKNIFVLDISPIPLTNFKSRNPDFPESQLLQIDFFDLTDKFDLVMEQTFFCAIDRILRSKYAEKIAQILFPNGKLVGVMFGVQFEKEGPPFGGSKDEYVKYFEPFFTIQKMEPCENSIAPRAGNELWVKLIRK